MRRILRAGSGRGHRCRTRPFVEEGTSLHYYEQIDFAQPDEQLFEQLKKIPGAKVLPIVTTDAVYRQTFYKEQLWREKGAVAVDMETSALWSVGKFWACRWLRC